jgi:hypothetical protein
VNSASGVIPGSRERGVSVAAIRYR